MKKFWIDFQGYCYAETEEAEEKFWNNLETVNMGVMYDPIFEIDGIEGKKDED